MDAERLADWVQELRKIEPHELNVTRAREDLEEAECEYEVRVVKARLAVNDTETDEDTRRHVVWQRAKIIRHRLDLIYAIARDWDENEGHRLKDEYEELDKILKQAMNYCSTVEQQR